RCVKLQNMYNMSKEQLVELFHRIAVPLPQRNYKDNRRGKLLTKLRRKQERIIQKAETMQEKSNVTYGFSESSNSLQQTSCISFNSHRTGDRLKPPPDSINFERKTIRLNSKSSDSIDLENIRIKRLKKFDNSGKNGDILDKIIINDRRREDKLSQDIASSEDKKPDSIGASKTDNSSSGVKKVKLKRSHITTTTESCNSVSTSSSSEAKKHRTIKWP
ncbi:hypothetical protein L9F63_001542, partial [Diploptera punctata]